MKVKGPRPHNKLTTLAVKALKKPGRYSDGNGLYIVVNDTGNKIAWEENDRTWQYTHFQGIRFPRGEDPGGKYILNKVRIE